MCKDEEIKMVLKLIRDGATSPQDDKELKGKRLIAYRVLNIILIAAVIYCTYKLFT